MVSGAALGSRVVVDADEAEHQEGRAAHKHQGKLHCGILLAACAPYADEKVHRDKSDLVEHEHREEVDRDKEAEYAGGERSRSHMKKWRASSIAQEAKEPAKTIIDERISIAIEIPSTPTARFMLSGANQVHEPV